MRTLITIVILGLFTSCENTGVTQTEVAAVDKVLDFYGGVCNRHKGFNAGSDGNQTYFELELSKSDLVEKYASMLDMPASNIAYIFYTNLGPEKTNYSNIKVKLNLLNGESHEYDFKGADIQEVETLTPVLKDACEKITSQDYEKLFSMFSADISKDLSVEKLKSYCTPYDSAFGQVKTVQLQGFAFFEGGENKLPLVHLAGITQREKKNTPITLFVDRKTKQIVTLKFEF